jgi:hypothetical protein
VLTPSDLNQEAPVGQANAPSRPRRVSLGLAVGVLLMPVVFIWFLLRAGYSTRSQLIGVSWLGVIGVIFLVSAPHDRSGRVPSGSGADNPSRAWETQAAPMVQDPDLSALDFSLGKTRAVYRMLRTPITLKNKLDRDLQYVEVFCSYYGERGEVLGHGMSNWATVKAGDTVSGEVVASGVEIGNVRRRECRARKL